MTDPFAGLSGYAQKNDRIEELERENERLRKSQPLLGSSAELGALREQNDWLHDELQRVNVVRVDAEAEVERLRKGSRENHEAWGEKYRALRARAEMFDKAAQELDRENERLRAEADAEKHWREAYAGEHMEVERLQGVERRLDEVKTMYDAALAEIERHGAARAKAENEVQLLQEEINDQARALAQERDLFYQLRKRPRLRREPRP